MEVFDCSYKGKYMDILEEYEILKDRTRQYLELKMTIPNKYSVWLEANKNYRRTPH